MIGKHLDGVTLERLVDRKLSAEQVLETGWHLINCGQCRSRLSKRSPSVAELFSRLFSDMPAVNADDSTQGYREAFAQAYSTLKDLAEVLERHEDADAFRVNELLALPADDRLARVEADGELRSLQVVRMILHRCWGLWTDQPAEAERVAGLGLELAQSLDERQHRRAILLDLQAQAWTYIANARRLQDNLRGSERAYLEAEACLEQGTGDPTAQAEFLEFQSALLRARRQFRDAVRMLNLAAKTYRQAGDMHLVGRCLVAKALTHLHEGEPAASIVPLRNSIELIDPGREPRLAVVTLGNFVDTLVELGEVEEAKAEMPEARTLVRKVGRRLDMLRLDWLDGRIALLEGRDQEAEKILLETRSQLCDKGSGYDVCIASLDLANLYLRQGRTREARQLIEEMLPIFQTREVHQEALAALLMLRRAVEIETASQGMVRDVTRFLERARYNPQLRYVEPS